MTSLCMSTSLLSKKVILVAILAVSAIAAILVVPPIVQATAQQHQKMIWSEEVIPQVNGSVSVPDEASNFVNENVKVSFVAAAETAQAQVTDGKVLGGHLGVEQGFLVYTFFVANTTNQTGHLTVIDAGNGQVLYISQGQPLISFSHWYGNGDGHGFGGWGGHWKGHGWGWGMWR
jgi:uncharacterized membrane protein YkoI